MYSILVVDDEFSIRESFSLILEGRYQVVLAASGEAALKAASDRKLDMAYLDIRMPGMDGIETLKRLREIDPELEIIMITAVNDVGSASRAIKLGARDYVVKPFDVEHILKLTEQILSKRAILKEGTTVNKKNSEIVGLDEILKKIEKLKGNTRVLVLGEAGTEKEAIARLIHEKSERSSFPFEALDLSRSIPAPEIRNLLFGRGKGFTTAELTGKSGLFEKTNNGSLFINNLEALPRDILKTIASGKFAREGSSTPLPLETRLIGGAAPDLAEQDREIFDFFSESVIEVPPLRRRASEIPLLVSAYLNRYNSEYKKGISFSPAAMESLTAYLWPGNTRELECLVHRFVLLGQKSRIEPEDLPLDILLKTTQGAGSAFITEFEKEYIHLALEHNGRDKLKTAAFLGINPAVLEAKL